MNIIKISLHPNDQQRAAIWFSKQWQIPHDAYLSSMQSAIDQPQGVPEWYLVLDEQQNIIAGAGVIENDFHTRTDLSPNLCALFVEQSYRKQGLARKILDFARQDYADRGFESLYLITDLNGFYERCGWNFLTMVTTDDLEPMKLYQAHCKV